MIEFNNRPQSCWVTWWHHQPFSCPSLKTENGPSRCSGHPRPFFSELHGFSAFPRTRNRNFQGISHLVTVGRMVGGGKEERWKRHIKPIWAHDFSTAPTSPTTSCASTHTLYYSHSEPLLPDTSCFCCLMLCKIWFISGWGVPSCP